MIEERKQKMLDDAEKHIIKKIEKNGYIFDKKHEEFVKRQKNKKKTPILTDK